MKKYKIKRFNVEADCTAEPTNGSMYEREHGEYVLYEDFLKFFRDIETLQIGSCNCLTKSPELKYHSTHCFYKKLKEITDKYM